MMSARCGVIVLAGGQSTRMGSDKARVKLNGRRLVDIMLDSLDPGTPRVVVSPFPLNLPETTPSVSEDPPFGGPVAGIAAGVSRLSTDFVAVLSVDAPRSARLLPALYTAVESSTSDCAVVRSSDGFVQPLCALWRKTSLLAALDALGDPRDKSAKSLLRHAKSVAEIAGNGDERDYDTAAELSELGDVQL